MLDSRHRGCVVSQCLERLSRVASHGIGAERRCSSIWTAVSRSISSDGGRNIGGKIDPTRRKHDRSTPTTPQIDSSPRSTSIGGITEASPELRGLLVGSTAPSRRHDETRETKHSATRMRLIARHVRTRPAPRFKPNERHCATKTRPNCLETFLEGKVWVWLDANSGDEAAVQKDAGALRDESKASAVERQSRVRVL